MNKVILIGRLTADPNLRYTQNGTPVATFTLAVDKPFVGEDGKRGADFIDIVAWRKLAEVVAQNITKGRLVAVEGRLQIRSYNDQNGIRRKAAEVIANEVKFLDRPKQEQTSEPEEPGWGEPEFDEVPF